MSTVIGIKDYKSESTVIVADSLCSNGSLISHRTNPKVFKLSKSNIIIGCVGSYRLFQVIEYFCDIKRAKSEKDPLKWLITKFVPNCIKQFEKNSLLWNDKDKVLGSALIAIDNKLFKYEVSNGQIGEYDLDYYSIGSGNTYSLGSLCTSEKLNVETNKRIELALSTSSLFDKSTEVRFDKLNKLSIDWKTNLIM